MRANVAEANGELRDGDRKRAEQWADTARGFSGGSIKEAAMARVKEKVAEYCKRIDRSITKLNQELAPLLIHAERNTDDPRGFPILLRSTDPTRPLPSNEMGGAYGIG
jgi:hypothetical protein